MARCSPRHPLVGGEGWRKNGRTADPGGAGGTEGAGRKDRGRLGGGLTTAFLGTQLAGVIPALAGPLATTAPGLGGVESFGY